MPAYYCNGVCPFCYLGNMIKDKTILNLTTLQQRLQQLKEFDCQLEIDLFGGEISLLDHQYIDCLIELCKQYSDKISISTNFTNYDNVVRLFDRGRGIVVSLNQERGVVHKTAINNIKQLPIEYRLKLSVMYVVLPSVLKIGANNFYNKLND